MRERITSRKNALISNLRLLSKQAKARREQRLFLLDGATLLQEALRYGGQIETILVQEGYSLPPLPEQVRVVEVPVDILADVAPSKTPQGVLTVCAMPDTTLPERLKGACYIIADTIQDPGNIGAMLRSADAFGADALLLSGASADPFGPKAVRASMGAVFRTPIYTGSDADICAALGDIPRFRADLTPDARPLYEERLYPSAIVIGSEGQGVSEFWRAETRGVIIPMRATCESLNAAVAASILLYEINRQKEGG